VPKDALITDFRVRPSVDQSTRKSVVVVPSYSKELTRMQNIFS
jgi:hypothetical protein